jgi:hypothetical protein
MAQDQRTEADDSQAAVYTYTGTLLRQAESRAAICDRQGRAVPVVCFDMELDNPLKTHMHIQQPFAPGNFAGAQAAAHRLKKGTRVTVQHPSETVRIVGTAATHVHVIKDTPKTQPHQEQTAPCQA